MKGENGGCQIRNSEFQFKIVEWLTRPGSQQLGAKWVEVTRRGEKALGINESELKRGQQHPLMSRLQLFPAYSLNLVGVASSKEGAAGVGQPFEDIAD